jgi:hypothetical protein
LTAWSEKWCGADQRLHAIEVDLREQGTTVLRGGAFDGWDLEVRCGTMGRARARMAIEEHGQGKQLIRLRHWPRVSSLAPAATGSLLILAAVCAVGGTLWLAAVLGAMSAVLLLRVIFESCAAAGALASSLRQTARSADAPDAAASEKPAPEEREAEIAA